MKLRLTFTGKVEITEYAIEINGERLDDIIYNFIKEKGIVNDDNPYLEIPAEFFLEINDLSQPIKIEEPENF